VNIGPFVTDPLQAILGGDPSKPSPFPESSRYARLETATLTAPDGHTIVYLRQRFVPSPSRFTQVKTHTVIQGDRLDNVTAKYLGDPEQFWQLCDANGALRPEELEVVGRTLRITLPVDIPEPASA
jgi:hypothetical protein